MRHNILINKWILGSIALLIIVSVSCYFWYQHETSPYKKEVAEANELIRQKEITHKTSTDSRTKDEINSSTSEASTDNISTPEGEVSDTDIENLLKTTGTDGKVSGADIEEILKTIAAEEEEVKESLSAEELRKQEIKKQVEEIQERMKQVIIRAGGKIHSVTHPEEMRQFLELQGEILALHKEAEGSTHPVLGVIHNLSVVTHNNLNSQGELSVSGAAKVAEYIAETGDDETAQRMQDLIKIALDSGDNVIKSEHLEAFQKQ